MGESFLTRLFKKKDKVSVTTAAVPNGVRAYAIGDIHGRLDLLQKLHGMILEDSESGSSEIRKVIIYLGDYIDRGFQSKEVIEFLIGHTPKDFEAIYLKGNHEAQFMKFLKAGEGGQGWLQFGGDATIFSYGVQIPNHLPIDDRFRHIQASLQEAVPEHHINFCSQLELTYELGDYLFVHAGINPYEPLDRQSESDLLWIRDEFIGSDVNLGKVIVHGHTINDVPDVQEYRIGIDTGAYISGKLTCLVLEGDTKRFLSTK